MLKQVALFCLRWRCVERRGTFR